MNEPNRRNEPFSRLRAALVSSAGHFKTGEDTAGLNGFSEVLELLESILDWCYREGKPQACFNRLLPALKLLDSAIQNRDIIGITDVLEDTFIPLADEWLAECETT